MMKPLLLAFILFCTTAVSGLGHAQDEETPPTDPAIPADASTQEDPATDPAPTDVAKSDVESTLTTSEEGSNLPLTEKVELPRVTPDLSLIRVRDVSRFLQVNNRYHEVMEFMSGEWPVTGLYLPENTGHPQGGVLILHDLEQHAHWPETVSPIREYLPDYGWNTLSLFLQKAIKRPLPKIPKPIAPASQPGAEPTESSEETATPAAEVSEVPSEDLSVETSEPPVDANFEDTSESANDALDTIAETLDQLPILETATLPTESEEIEELPEDQFLQRSTDQVTASLQQLNSLGQFNLVIIAHGISANWAVAALNDRLKDNPDAKGFALILVDAYPSQYPEYPLNTMLANINIPVLDIYTGLLDTDERIATDRKNSVMRKQRSHYQQIKIPAVRTSLSGKHNVLSRRVRGWLLSNAAGEEVKVKVKKQ